MRNLTDIMGNVRLTIELERNAKRSDVHDLRMVLTTGGAFLTHNERVALQRRFNAIVGQVEEIEEQLIAIANCRQRAIAGRLPDGSPFMPVEPEPESETPLPPVSRKRKVRIR